MHRIPAAIVDALRAKTLARVMSGGQHLLAVWLPLILLPLIAMARFALQNVPVVLLGWSNLFDKWSISGITKAFHDPDFRSALMLSVKLAVGDSTIGGGGLSLAVGPPPPPPQAEMMSITVRFTATTEICLAKLLIGTIFHFPYFFQSGCETRNSRCCSIST